VRRDAAQLVREHTIEGVADAVHGACFDGRHLVLAAGYRLFRLVPDSGRVVDQLETFPAPGGLAYDGRHAWQLSEGRFQAVELRTGFVAKSIGPGIDGVTGIECFEGDLLVLHAGGRCLSRIETLDATTVARVETDVLLRGLTWGAGQLWSSTGNALVCIDPASARVLKRITVPSGVEVVDMTGDGEGRLWCADGKAPGVRAFVRPRVV
jgi:hypothetical protein